MRYEGRRIVNVHTLGTVRYRDLQENAPYVVGYRGHVKWCTSAGPNSRTESSIFYSASSGRVLYNLHGSIVSPQEYYAWELRRC